MDFPCINMLYCRNRVERRGLCAACLKRGPLVKPWAGRKREPEPYTDGEPEARIVHDPRRDRHDAE